MPGSTTSDAVASPSEPGSSWRWNWAHLGVLGHGEDDAKDVGVQPCTDCSFDNLIGMAVFVELRWPMEIAHGCDQVARGKSFAHGLQCQR